MLHTSHERGDNNLGIDIDPCCVSDNYGILPPWSYGGSSESEIWSMMCALELKK